VGGGGGVVVLPLSRPQGKSLNLGMDSLRITQASAVGARVEAVTRPPRRFLIRSSGPRSLSNQSDS